MNESNLNSVMMALSKYGSEFGLDLPHRVVAFLAQLMHESGSFKYDREIWGPTPAQERYDTRSELGNTPAKMVTAIRTVVAALSSDRRI